MDLVFIFQQGEPLCIFYSRYGICKFGPSCKFDHPMGIFTYNLSASSSADAPVVRRLLGSSSGSAALTLSSDGLVEAGSTKPRRLSLPETRQMPPGDDNIDTEGWSLLKNWAGYFLTTIFWSIKQELSVNSFPIVGDVQSSC